MNFLLTKLAPDPLVIFKESNLKKIQIAVSSTENDIKLSVAGPC